MHQHLSCTLRVALCLPFQHVECRFHVINSLLCCRVCMQTFWPSLVFTPVSILLCGINVVFALLCGPTRAHWIRIMNQVSWQWVWWVRVVVLAVEPVEAHSNALFRSYTFVTTALLGHVSAQCKHPERIAHQQCIGRAAATATDATVFVSIAGNRCRSRKVVAHQLGFCATRALRLCSAVWRATTSTVTQHGRRPSADATTPSWMGWHSSAISHPCNFKCQQMAVHLKRT